MSLAAILVLALLLDAMLGEPRWLWDRLPHPAVLMGRAVAALEQHLNSGAQRRIKGAAATLVLSLGAWALGAILSEAGWLVSMIVAAILIAQRSLVDHVQAVADALRLSVGDGRLAVARIVGRDTAQMDQTEIARAAIESAAENFSDAVVAPAFWFLVAGLPGLVLYKTINTADSMIGHRSERYAQFGWAAARLDDLLNVVPARLTAVLILSVHFLLPQWRNVMAEAGRHRSPNAGWPEAALARALDVALSGPRAYEGQIRTYPFVNPTGQHAIGPAQIDSACKALWRNWTVLVLTVCALALLLG